MPVGILPVLGAAALMRLNGGTVGHRCSAERIGDAIEEPGRHQRNPALAGRLPDVVEVLQAVRAVAALIEPVDDGVVNGARRAGAEGFRKIDEADHSSTSGLSPSSTSADTPDQRASATTCSIVGYVLPVSMCE